MQVPELEFSKTSPAALPAIDTPARSARSERAPARSPRQYANMAKTARSIRRPETQRAINQNNKKRINPVLSMSQRICPEIQSVSVQFATLAVLIRNFLTDNSISTLNPDFPNIFSALSLAFDTYCHQCTLMFSNVTRAPSQRNFHPASPVYVQGRLLMVKWVGFIETINNLVDSDVEPYRAQIHNYIMEYKNIMRTAMDYMKKTQYYPQPLVNALKGLCTKANKCEQKLLILFNPQENKQPEPVQQKPPENENTDMNEAPQNQEENDIPNDLDEEEKMTKYMIENYKDYVYPNRKKSRRENYEDTEPQIDQHTIFQNMFYNLIDATTTMFEQTLPKDSIPIRRAMKLKINAVNQCAKILEVVNAIEQFQTSISKIKAQINIVNNELNNVHKQLNLPFIVTLTIGDDKKMETATR